MRAGRRWWWGAVAGWLAVPFGIGVQTQAVTSYELRVYAQGGLQPVQTFAFQPSAVACNLAPSPANASTVNPTKVEWDDPANDGRACRYEQASGPLLALPVGSYEGVVVSINAGGPSPESNRSPFERLDPLGALSGVRFVR